MTTIIYNGCQHLAEGYATAASIFEATGQRVLVCFSAGNLPAVAQAVRAVMPDVQIVVCADNDLPDKNGRRAGIDKAEEAAALDWGHCGHAPNQGRGFQRLRGNSQDIQQRPAENFRVAKIRRLLYGHKLTHARG